jgi:histone acetyltransferase
VKNPTDVKTIEKKLANNEYKDRESFCDDVKRIFENCRLYNQPETVYYKCAGELEEYIKPHLESLKEGRVELNGNEFKRPTKNSKKKTVEKKTKK